MMEIKKYFLPHTHLNDAQALNIVLGTTKVENNKKVLREKNLCYNTGHFNLAGCINLAVQTVFKIYIILIQII